MSCKRRKISEWTVSSFRSPNRLLAAWLMAFYEGVLFAALAFARGRRDAFPAGRLGLWTAIGFTRGPFGFVGMLSVLEWPALEEVPACGRSSMVTRDSCEHCSKPFTPPRADGRSTRTHHALKTFRTREWAPPAGRVEGCHRCFCTPHPPLRGPFSLGEEFTGNVFRIPYVSF